MPGFPLLGILVYGPFAEAHLILWVALLAYSAYTFLVIVQETAAGSDKIHWPDDPWPDRLGCFAYLAFLVALWWVPLYYLYHFEIVQFSGWTWALLAYGFLWLLFPISLLSSLSARSRWVLFRPALVVRLLRRLPALLLFYLVSGIVLTLGLGVFGLAVSSGLLAPPDVTATGTIGWLFDLVLMVGQVALLPVAAVVAAVCMMIYARLLGRLGWLLNQGVAVHDEFLAAPADDPSSAPAAPAAEISWIATEEKPELSTVLIPPPGAIVPPLEPGEVYALLPEDPPPAALPLRPRRGSEDNPFVMLPPEPPDRQKAALAVPFVQASNLEMRLAWQSPLPRRPAWTFFSGVWNFPFYRSNLWPLLWLSLGNLVVGGLLYALVNWIF